MEVVTKKLKKEESQATEEKSDRTTGERETSQRVPSDLQRGLAEAKKQAKETPWNLRRFQKEPTGGNDQWQKAY